MFESVFKVQKLQDFMERVFEEIVSNLDDFYVDDGGSKLPSAFDWRWSLLVGTNFVFIGIM